MAANRISTKSSTSNSCRMRSRRLLRIRTEKTNTINFWRGYAGVGTMIADNPSPQLRKNQHIALARKRSAVDSNSRGPPKIAPSSRNGKKGSSIAESTSSSATGVSYSLVRKPLQSLPDFLKLSPTTPTSSSTKKSSKNSGNTEGGGGGGVRDAWGSDLRSAAEFASCMSYALGAISTLSAQAAAQKAASALEAFNKEVITTASEVRERSAADEPLPHVGGEKRVGGGGRKRQSQRGKKKTHATTGDIIIAEQQCASSENETDRDPRRSVIGALSSGLSKYYSSMCHNIAKQTVTGTTSGSTFKTVLLKVGGITTTPTTSPSSNQTTTAAIVVPLRTSTITSRLTSVNALLDAFESINAIQRRVQSRRTMGSMNNSSKPCSRDFTSKVLMYARKKNKRAD